MLETTYNFTVVATDVELQDSPKAFSITIVVSDPYFKNTVLLLQGDATPFTADASTNKFELSAVGTPSANVNNPLQPGYYSGKFDGSGYYLSVPTNAVFNFGAGAYTVEMWIYPTATTIDNVTNLFQMGTHVGGGNFLELIVENTAGVNTLLGNLYNSSAYKAQPRSTTISNYLNTWHHAALIFTGTTYYVSWDGILSTGVAYSGSDAPTGQTVYIGAFNASTPYFTGYMSNLRVVKGVAVYTGAFTPPTAPLAATQSSSGNIVAITGTSTSLLALQSNRFIDNSSTPNTITAYGTTSISVNQPFTLPSPYTGYGAGYFDGTNNNSLTVVNSASHAAFDMLSSNYTIEFWVYPTAAVSTLQGLVTKYSTVISFNIAFSSGNTWSISIAYGGASYLDVYLGAMPTLNTWHHAALVRNGANILFYVDGIQLATVGAQDMRTSGASICIGNFDALSFPLISSHVSNVRIVKGVAVYTGTFTPPTLASLTNAGATSAACYPSTTNVNTTFASSATSLLTLQTNQAQNNNQFRDSSTNNFAITRTGTPTQGTFTPFSQTGWSGYFKGTTDYLSVASNAAFAFGTENFTVEAWVYISSSASEKNIVSTRGSAASVNAWSFSINASNGFVVYSDNYIFNTSSNILLNSWNHVVFTREGTGTNQTKLYVNGINVASITNSQNFTSQSLAVGASNTGAQFPFDGYISNLRIVKGTALYTAAFTPPTAPLTAVSGTSLLTLQSNYFKDNSSNNFAITATGTPSVQAFSPFAPSTAYSTTLVGGSIYINGSSSTASNCLTLPGTNYVAYLGDGSFTVECWIYMVGTPPDSNGFQLLSNYGGAGSGWGFWLNQARLLAFNGSGDGYDITGTTAVPINSWHHVALCSTAGTSFKIFLNGIQEGSTFTGGVSFNSGYSIRVGQFYFTGDYNFYAGFNGYISNLRIVKGTTVYTGAFTPPTAPLTATQSSGINISAINGGTVVLLSATNSGIFDATGKNDLITVGDARASTSVTKYGTGAMYFDGTGDYLTMPASPNLELGSGNFTIEFWIYAVGGNSLYCWSTDWHYAMSWNYGGASSNRVGIWASSNGSTWNIFNADGGGNGISTGTISTSTWTHVALVRNGSAWALYLNGTSAWTGTSSATIVTRTDTFRIGGPWPNSGPTNFNGYIDDLRITKEARYTTTFTPPSQAMLGM